MKFTCTPSEQITKIDQLASKSSSILKKPENNDIKQLQALRQKEQTQLPQYEKIKPPKLEKLDIDLILADFNKTNPEKKSVKQKKQKAKKSSKHPKKPLKQNEIAPKMILTTASSLMISSFREMLSQMFQDDISPLGKVRKTNLEKIFNYLCYGLQQLTEDCKKDNTSVSKLENINQNDIVALLKERVFGIDQALLNVYCNNTNQSKLTLQTQWKFIIDMLKQNGNKKLRLGILTQQIKPSLLVYARETDLIKYLSAERQKYLKTEEQKILKISEADDMKFHFERDEQSKGESWNGFDSKTTIYEGQTFDQIQSKSMERKRFKPKSKIDSEDKEEFDKKVKKLKESICK